MWLMLVNVLCSLEKDVYFAVGVALHKCQLGQIGYSLLKCSVFLPIFCLFVLSIIGRIIEISDYNCGLVYLFLLAALPVIAYIF